MYKYFFIVILSHTFKVDFAAYCLYILDTRSNLKILLYKKKFLIRGSEFNNRLLNVEKRILNRISYPIKFRNYYLYICGQTLIQK